MSLPSFRSINMSASSNMDTEIEMETDTFPSELQDRLTAFDDSLSKLEENFNSLHSYPLSELQSRVSSLERAKLDLLGVYAINSLFWMYLNTKGENPKEHGVKLELDRIKSYMARVKEIQEKELAPKINKDATKKFVRSALWQAAHKQSSKRPNSQESSGDSSSSPVKVHKKGHSSDT